MVRLPDILATQKLALLSLYKVTSNEKHLKLAQFFIKERGNPTGGAERRHYYDVESEARGENKYTLPMYCPLSTNSGKTW